MKEEWKRERKAIVGEIKSAWKGGMNHERGKEGKGMDGRAGELQGGWKGRVQQSEKGE